MIALFYIETLQPKKTSAAVLKRQSKRKMVNTVKLVLLSSLESYILLRKSMAFRCFAEEKLAANVLK